MKRRALSLVLTAAMLAGACLAGCGQSEQEQQDTVAKTESEAAEQSTVASQDAETSEAASDEEVDIWAPFDETVTITTVKSDYSYIEYPEGDDIDNNAWTRVYKDRFNIEVVNEWVSDDYDTKLNLQIAEGKIPDLVRVNATQLKQLAEAGMLCDLTEAYETYASDRIKSFEEYDQKSFESGIFDGKLYGLAQLHYGLETQYDFVWIRQDWLKECGLDAPQTMDDVENIAKVFMEKYGAYGLTADKTLASLNVLAPGWGAHPDMWVRDDAGNIVYGATTEEYKNALAAYAEWYEEGIISKDFITMDEAKVIEDVINGKVGIMPWYLWWGAVVGTDHVATNGFEAIFKPYKIPSANGETVLHSINNGNATYVAVSKECEHPEAVIKMINFEQYMRSSESLEKETEEFLDSFDGTGDTQANARVLEPMLQMRETTTIYDAIMTGDPSQLPLNDLEKYNNTLEYIEDPAEYPERTHQYLMYGFEDCTTKWVVEHVNNGEYLENVLWAYTPESLLDYGATLDTILLEGFTKIIVGEEPIDYFDTVVENWKAAGGEQVTAEMEALYN